MDENFFHQFGFSQTNLLFFGLTTFSIVAIDNLFYSLPYSVYLVLCGDAMILCSAAIVGVIVEIAHVYDEAELTSKLGITCAFKIV